MKIIADKNMPLLGETFAHYGEVIRIGGREICRRDLDGASVLLVRSVTRVDRELLQDTDIQFVGSATIGIDHLDIDWLEANGIGWAHAPGCNADAAAQYTLAMMWLACDRLQQDLREQSVGIVGRGNVGRRLETLLNVLKIPVMSCDPPLQDQGEENLVGLSELCNNSIISLHTPLTDSGKYPTRNLFDAKLLAGLQADTLIVNASRGGVIEGAGLIEQLISGRLHAALDVWPDEPFIEQKLLAAVAVASPHVAGYSRQGKQAGTQMIFDAFCKAFSYTDHIDAIKTKQVNLSPLPSVCGDNLLKHSIYSSSQIKRDDNVLRTLPPTSQNGNKVHIDSLRANYPERYEFNSFHVKDTSHTDANLLKQLGFKVE
jgi:erythronate-4-phosphate dehydrogenase